MCQSLCHRDRRVVVEPNLGTHFHRLQTGMARHSPCCNQDMGQTHFKAVRFVLARILPAALLVACGSATGGEHPGQGGAPAVADAGSGGSNTGSGHGGSKAGSDSALGGDTSGVGGRGGSFSVADSSDLGGNGTQAGSSGADTGGAAGEPISCGTSTCGPSQYCVIPCCGGAAPMCFPAPSDGSTCPTGSHAGCSTHFGTCAQPANCCQFDDCTPPSPYCTDEKPQICFPSPGQPGAPGADRICRMMCA